MSKKIESKSIYEKIVNRVFALVVIFASLGTIFFAIWTVINNINLSKVDYSSYISYVDDIDINSVYGASEYKISHTITIKNHARERMVVDMVLTYESSSGSIFVKNKTVTILPVERQNVYVYYYYDDSGVTLKSLNFRVEGNSNFSTMYKDDVYDRLYQDVSIVTFSTVLQSIMLMAMCILVLIISIVLYLITKSMFKSNAKKSRRRKVKNESNRSEQSL